MSPSQVPFHPSCITACAQAYLVSQGIDHTTPNHKAIVTNFLDNLVEAAKWKEGPPTRAGKKGKPQYKGPNSRSVSESMHGWGMQAYQTVKSYALPLYPPPPKDQEAQQ